MAHPLVTVLLTEIDRQGIKFATLERKAGVGEKTIRAWRRNHAPLVHNLEAVGNCLGMTLRWVAIGHGHTNKKHEPDAAKPVGNGVANG